MKRFEAALLAGLIISLVLAPWADFAGDCAQVRQEVLRLHILAESDSDEDQSNKLAVRDAILERSSELLNGVSDVEQAIMMAGEHLDEIEQTARRTLRQRGCDADVKVSLERTGFATRTYGLTTLPAGQYNALRVVIGEGQGHNWWCVMYPPLCLPAAQSGEKEQQDIAMLEQRPGYRMGFALVELWETAAQKLQELAIQTQKQS